MGESTQFGPLSQLENLEALVDELMKDAPEDGVVKSYMEKSGIPYVEDPIERIQSVLTAIQFQSTELEIE